MNDRTSSTDDPHRVVETSAIGQITQVHVYDSTMLHIAEEHPETAPVINSVGGAIVDALADPTSVIRSNPRIYPDSYKFCSTRSTLGNNQLVVAVKVHSGTSAYVKTAYFDDVPVGEVLWRADDD